MSAHTRPFASHLRSFCVLGVLGGVLLLPASASAAPPTCPDVAVSVLHGRSLPFSTNPCTGGNGQLTLTSVTMPQHGQLTTPGGTPQYTPNAGFVGTDSFTYKSTDQTPEDSNTATVTIQVTDQAPICNDTSTTTQTGHPVDISQLFDCDDPDGEGFDIFFGDGDHGVTDASGSTYTPDAGFVGTDQIPFQADDGALQSAVRFISITVTSAPALVVQPPPVVPITPADTSRPVFSATHPKQSLADARKRGVRLTETSNEAGKLTVTITVDRKTARKLKIKRGAKGAVRVGTLTRTIQAGSTAFRVKLTSKAREALNRARKVTLLVTVKVADAAGNATTHAMTVTLKR